MPLPKGGGYCQERDSLFLADRPAGEIHRASRAFGQVLELPAVSRDTEDL